MSDGPYRERGRSEPAASTREAEPPHVAGLLAVLALGMLGADVHRDGPRIATLAGGLVLLLAGWSLSSWRSGRRTAR